MKNSGVLVIVYTLIHYIENIRNKKRMFTHFRYKNAQLNTIIFFQKVYMKVVCPTRQPHDSVSKLILSVNE